jgi:hypothetical protein
MKTLSNFLRYAASTGFAKFNQDGSVEVQIEDVPNSIWQKYSDAMRSLGYEYRGAEDAKELTKHTAKGKDTAILKDEHAKAFAVAVGKKDLHKPKSNKSIINKAIKEFGLTNDPSLAGYILDDGRMLNFGEYGTRSKDHSEIGFILPDEGDTHLRGHSAIKRFCELGNIRLLYSSNSIGFDVYKRPSSAQINVLEDILHLHSKGKHIYVDVPGFHEDFDSNDPDVVLEYIKRKTGY